MLFVLPLAACNNNNGGGGSGSGDSGGGSGSGGGGSGSGGGGSGGGGGGSSLTAKGEATRIAAEMYGIDEDEVTFADYEDEEAEAHVYKYESSKLSFYMTGYYDDEMSYEEMVSDIKSYMPSGTKKNETYSYGKEDLSEDGITYIYFDEVYTKDGMAYNVIVDYYEDDEYGIDSTASICVLKESQLAAYDEYFSSEEDDDWDDDDDWEDDDDDDEGGGGEVGPITGTVTLNFANGLEPSGSLNGVVYESNGLTTDENGDGHAFNQLRLYAENTLTISAGSNMTSITFTFKDKKGPLSADVGSISGTTWTGSAKSVTFTASAQARIVSIDIK